MHAVHVIAQRPPARWCTVVAAGLGVVCAIVLVVHAAAPALINAKILTIDQAFSTAQAMAITGTRIVAVGPNDRIRSMAGQTTRVVDLGGRTVVPGMWDAHNQQYSGAEICATSI